ncbi:MAG TPA: hypothetical protein VFY34_16000 [Pyrinomonadaceae bacterium]|nr:hypothetical protein [Pyrinomonadaceae bacterium]
MAAITYKLTINKWSVDSANDPRTEFLMLDTQHSVDASADYCRITVYAPPPPKPGLLEQAAAMVAAEVGLGGSASESFSVSVRGNQVKHGDQMTVELTVDDASTKIFTAEVNSIKSALGQTVITGTTGKQKLANARLNQIYSNQGLDQITKDLAQQASVNAGDIQSGATYSYFVVHDAKSVLRQLHELAFRDGMDLYCDAENKLVLKKFEKTKADHTFYYGIHVLDLQLSNYDVVSDHFKVYGESPSSQQGSDTWHWFAKDLSPFTAEIGSGGKLLVLQDSAAKTKDAAGNLATAKAGALKDRASRGLLKILGNPLVKLGDAIEIKEAPKPELNGLFKVTSVRHVLSKWQGYLTFVGFSGQGGAQTLAGALGQLAGAVGL